MALGILASARQWNGKKIAYLVLCGVGLMVVCAPFAIGVLRHCNIAGVAHLSPHRPLSWEAVALRGWEQLWHQFRQAHPVLLFLGFAGIWFLPRRGMRLFYGPVFWGLALIMGWGACWRPDYHLERTAILLFFLATLPAGLWIGDLLEHTRGWVSIKALLLALLIMGSLNTSRWYGNEDPIYAYHTFPADTYALTQWLQRNTKKDGRISMFADVTKHAYGGAHVAYLPVLTDREMMACDYYHFSPRLLEYNYPPPPFRATRETLFTFMEVYNVTYVITCLKGWMDRFDEDPEHYQRVYRYTEPLETVVYRVIRKPDYWLQGSGEISRTLTASTSIWTMGARKRCSNIIG